MPCPLLPAAAALLTLLGFPLRAAQPASEDIEFFEARIRPVLAAECYECHNSHTQTKAGLALDHRAGLLKGGDSGPAIVPGHPDKSLLLQAIRHASTELRMPKDGARLADVVVADFAAWIQRGAPDPRDHSPSAESLSREASWETTFQQRKQWWSFQPIRKASPPPGPGAPHPVDRFIRARLQSEQLPHSPPADRRVLIRRLTFALTGLPPTPEEIDAFLEDPSPDADTRLVDRLLESPRFGERWARHWMDWLRYAESHGSEGDPPIPEAWRYRDYLIRALNDDIPYDQLVLEHLAGDLLDAPRTREEGRLDESALGTAHLRMVFHGFNPTDALDEQVRFTENQVDVVTKSFLGLTVACARCHNHKFDAISQADFHALYGVFATSRPATITLDRPEPRRPVNLALRELKRSIRSRLADAWLLALEGWGGQLPDTGPWRKAIDEAAKDETHSLHPWARWQAAAPEQRFATWDALQTALRESRERLRSRRAGAYERYWNLAGSDAAQWFKEGPGLVDMPSRPGEFHVLPEGDRILAAILPGGVYSHLLSSRDSAVLHSPRFGLEGGSLWIRMMGRQEARARYVVHNYPRAGGLLYPIARPDRDAFSWQRWDVEYWKGDQVHLEVATARDVPIEISDKDRSWFGVREALHALPGQPEPREEPAEHWSVLLDDPSAPESGEALARRYLQAVRQCVTAWRNDQLTDEQAFFLDDFIGLFPTDLAQVPQARPLVERHRQIEAAIPLPTRAPGVMEGTVIDQPLFIRGNHRQPTNAVPRRFLEAIDPTPYPDSQSGRLDLARDILRQDNPLTARVIVNRLWHHLFGRGLVASTDNFGRLGDMPTHPELLDELAARMIEQGWSIKRMIRLIVLSETYRQDSTPSPAARAKDPDNRLLSHFPLLRLDAEAVRDAILLTSGRLDTAMYGPGVDGNSNRRSVYLRVIRNDLDPFLATFDAPEPLTTRGRRNVTNVPGQSLALLNAPFVIDAARQWAGALLADPGLAESGPRIDLLYRRALGRPAQPDDIRRAEGFLADMRDAAALLASRFQSNRQAILDLESRRAAILDPVRHRLLSERRSGAPAPGSLPAPVWHWDFEGPPVDRVAGLKLRLIDGATLERGALVLRGQAHAASDPLPRDLREKTLAARVLVDLLSQQGGGALTVQSADGNVFDAIVFGERAPRQWLAGSDFFNRTRDFAGPEETASPTEPVHVAITYHADGLITAYRNGEPYGQPYRGGGPVTFQAGQSVVLLGCRHTPPGANKHFTGRILEAKIYDRALEPGEVQAACRDSDNHVSDADLLQALSASDRAALQTLESHLAALREERARMEKERAGDPQPHQEWRDLAQSMFNLKEFIYTR